MSGIQAMLLGAVNPLVGYNLSWTTNYGDTTTIDSATVVSATTSNNGNGYGYFSDAFPASVSVYVDVILNIGYASGVNFLGVSNEVSQFAWGDSGKYEAWYWSGSWFGGYTTYVNPPTALVADTYRIAINRTNGRLYMKRNGDATVASANLPSGSTFYLMNLPQNGFRTSGATIVNGKCYEGSGGLY